MNYFYRIWDKLEDWYLKLESFSDPSPFGKTTQKYWIRRNQIFPHFDRGFQTDAVGLFSATPRKIAKEIASNIHASTVADAFCGIGCTAIAFAKSGKTVYAVELNEQRISMARHNARLEQADENIEFINADIFSQIDNLRAEAIFLDPPWGGTDYLKLEKFTLANFPLDMRQLLQKSLNSFAEVILRVPRQFDINELNQFGRKYKVQENKIRSKIFSKTVYFE